MIPLTWKKPRLALAAIPLLLIAGAVSLSSHVEDAFAQPANGVQTLVFMRHAENRPTDLVNSPVRA